MKSNWGFAIEVEEYTDSKYGNFYRAHFVEPESFGIEAHARSEKRAVAFALEKLAERMKHNGPSDSISDLQSQGAGCDPEHAAVCAAGVFVP